MEKRCDHMKRALMFSLLVLAQLACGSTNDNANGGRSGNGGGSGAGGAGAGGTNSAGSTPLFQRAECGSIAGTTALKPATGATPATVFAAGQLVGGRVDPDSTTNQEHHWSIQ